MIADPEVAVEPLMPVPFSGNTCSWNYVKFININVGHFRFLGFGGQSTYGAADYSS